MNCARITALLLSFFAAVVAAPVAHAQGDAIRLSTPEPTTTTLPVAMRTQSAATIGDRTLVAWGTVERDANAVARNVLRVQLVQGGAPVDATFDRVHDAEARPNGLLHVASAAGRFDVYFADDRRNAEGLYVRSYNLDGAPLGPERHIIAGRVEDLVTYRDVGAMTVLLRDYVVRFVREDGTIDTGALDFARFALPHILRADSVLDVLRDGTIERFAHYRDALPASLSVVNVADSLFPSAWKLTEAGNGN